MPDNNEIKFRSRMISDYEILIKRTFDKSSAYCPQLNKLIKGKIEDDVEVKMKLFIEDHIKSLPLDEEEIKEREELLRQAGLDKNTLKDEIKKDLLNKFKSSDGESTKTTQKEIKKSDKTSDSSNIPIKTKEVIEITEFTADGLDGIFYNSDNAI